jgi:hypothetical protein
MDESTNIKWLPDQHYTIYSPIYASTLDYKPVFCATKYNIRIIQSTPVTLRVISNLSFESITGRYEQAKNYRIRIPQ